MIYAMFAMVVLTFLVGCIAFFTRVNSVKQKQLSPKDFKLMDAERYPDNVIKTTRCFNNQFEVPVLFYAACLCYLTLDASSYLGVLLAWGFVVCRIAHAYIHITYNHLLHRIIAFWLAVLMVMALWLNLLVLQW